MDTPRNFRSAFNGFNREDVVRYIEYMNAQHVAQLHELNIELEFLRGKLAAAVELDPAVQKRLDDYKEQVTILENRCDALEKERDALEKERDAAAQANCHDTALEEQLRALEARCEALTQECDAAIAEKEAATVQAGAELEAYRRAERAERVARERAELVYHQVNGVLADATVKVEQAAGQMNEMSEQFLARLDALRSAVDGSRQSLTDAAQTMYALRPQTEE